MFLQVCFVNGNSDSPSVYSLYDLLLKKRKLIVVVKIVPLENHALSKRHYSYCHTAEKCIFRHWNFAADIQWYFQGWPLLMFYHWWWSIQAKESFIYLLTEVRSLAADACFFIFEIWCSYGRFHKLRDYQIVIRCVPWACVIICEHPSLSL